MADQKYIIPPRTTDGNEIRKFFINICQLLNGMLNIPAPKLISTTHDISVTGDQAITGVGFKPSGGIVWLTVDETLAASWGMFDSTKAIGALNANRADTEDTFQPDTALGLYLGSGNAVSLSIASLDDDGLTVTWTKFSSPTGTATLKFLLFKLFK